MELEVKIHRAEEDTAYNAITEHLRERGIVLCKRQESKTMRLFHEMAYTPQDGYEVIHGYELLGLLGSGQHIRIWSLSVNQKRPEHPPTR